MTRSVLVTGAAGFIGANFVHHWAQNHPEDCLVAFDKLTYAGNRQSLAELEQQGQVHFVEADICDAAAVSRALKDYAVDTVVHFAAESHVDRSITGPDAFIQTNVVGTHTLLAAAKDAWLGGSGRPHRFHHVSTDEVFGSLTADDPAFHEQLRYQPNSPYSASKAGGDHLVRAYHHTYGLDVTTSNYSNNYGPFHFPEKLIPLCLLNILMGESLPIYGDGKQIRDWLFVDDHARGIELIIRNGRRGETYNIGGNNEWANIDVVKLLCSIVDQRFADNPRLSGRFPDSPCASATPAGSLIAYVEDRPGHDTRYAINAEKIMTELGYQPVEDFESGLNKTVNWYLANEAWWQSILNGSTCS